MIVQNYYCIPNNSIESSFEFFSFTFWNFKKAEDIVTAAEETTSQLSNTTLRSSCGKNKCKKFGLAAEEG